MPNAVSKLSGDNNWARIDAECSQYAADRQVVQVHARVESQALQDVRQAQGDAIAGTQGIETEQVQQAAQRGYGVGGVGQQGAEALVAQTQIAEQRAEIQIPQPDLADKLLRSRPLNGVLPRPSASIRPGRLMSMFADVSGASRPL